MRSDHEASPPSSTHVPSPPFLHPRVHSAGLPGDLALSAGTRGSQTCWDCSWHPPGLGMCLTCSKGNSLRDKVKKLTKLQFAVPYKHAQAPFSALALICNAELSVQAKQYLDSGRELIKTLQSFVWICTTVIRWLWVEEKVFFPTFPLRFCPQRLGLTVQMTGAATLRPEHFQGRDVPWWRRGPEVVASCHHGCPALF